MYSRYFSVDSIHFSEEMMELLRGQDPDLVPSAAVVAHLGPLGLPGQLGHVVPLVIPGHRHEGAGENILGCFCLRFHWLEAKVWMIFFFSIGRRFCCCRSCSRFSLPKAPYSWSPVWITAPGSESRFVLIISRFTVMRFSLRRCSVWNFISLLCRGQLG